MSDDGRIEEINRMHEVIRDAAEKANDHTAALDPDRLIGLIAEGCSCALAVDYYIVEVRCLYSHQEWASIRDISPQAVSNNIHDAKMVLEDGDDDE